MTVNLLVAVEDDGLVMCADSMLTLTQQMDEFSQITTTFENAEKLITFGRDRFAAAAMVSGAGDIGGILVSTLLRRVSREMIASACCTHDEVLDRVSAAITPVFNAMVARARMNMASFLSQLDKLAEINEKRAQHNISALTEVKPEHIGVRDEPNPPQDCVFTLDFVPVTIVVCSYLRETQAATELRWPWERRIVHVPGRPLAWWGSGSTAIARLVRGFDLPTLMDHTAASHRDSPLAQTVLDYATRYEEEYLMPTPIAQLPLQDAIEFAEYLGKVACGYDKFKVGPAGVGGELDVLVLRPGTRSWVRRKRIRSSLPAG